MDFKVVKERVKIEDVFRDFFKIENVTGKNVDCPIGAHKSKSLKIYSETASWYCHSCGKGGDAIELVAKAMNIAPLEACRKIAEMYGIKEEKKSEKIAYSKYEYTSESLNSLPIDQVKIRQWLSFRKIPYSNILPLLEKRGVKYHKPSDMLVFPLQNTDDKVSCVQKISLFNGKKYLSGGAGVFPAIVSDDWRIFIVEAIANALSLASIGINAVACGSKNCAKSAIEWARFFASEKTIFLWLDYGLQEREVLSIAKDNNIIPVFWNKEKTNGKDGFDHNDLLKTLQDKKDFQEKQRMEMFKQEIETMFASSFISQSGIGEINENGKVVIDDQNLFRLAKMLGFSFIEYVDENSLCRQTGYFAEPVSLLQIKNFMFSTVFDGLNPNSSDQKITKKLISQSGSLISKEKICCFKKDSADFLLPTEKEAFFPYQNGIVRVTPDDIELLSYSKVKKTIWKNAVIKRNFQKDTNLADENQFKQFLMCTATFFDQFQEDRYKNILSSIAYGLHCYRSPSNMKAVVFTEANVDEKGNIIPNSGGSGKGLIGQALSLMGIKRVVVDGKGEKEEKDPRFWLSRVTPETKIVFIDDVSRKFDIEKLFSLITEGMEIDKKGKQSIFLEPSRCPIFWITSNSGVLGMEGPSAKRRILSSEITNFFNEKRQPKSYFPNEFFLTAWNEDEKHWIGFDNFMLETLQWYLKYGYHTFESPTARKKNAINAVGITMFKVLEEMTPKNAEKPRYHTIDEILSMYVEQINNTNKKPALNTIYRSISAYCREMKLSFTKDRVLNPATYKQDVRYMIYRDKNVFTEDEMNKIENDDKTVLIENVE